MTTKEMSCHVWALSGDPENARRINAIYHAELNKIGTEYEYGNNLHDKPLVTIRKETMEKVSELCDRRTQHIGNNVYLCGGFRGSDVCPEHVWLEDHTTTKTYDTEPGKVVRRVNGVGREGQQFQPGNGTIYRPEQIARVLMKGYTKSQNDSLPLSSHFVIRP